MWYVINVCVRVRAKGGREMKEGGVKEPEGTVEKNDDESCKETILHGENILGFPHLYYAVSTTILRGENFYFFPHISNTKGLENFSFSYR